MDAADARASISASVLLMTCLERCPERAPLFRFILERAICQHVEQDRERHEVLVLDDKPACAAWPIVASLAPKAAARGVRLRYVALPPAEDGCVNMRLKRNVGLLLCRGSAAVFFDDDDWRSVGSLQMQLNALDDASLDVCTLQVSTVCELDPSTGCTVDGGCVPTSSSPASVRYLATPGGGGS